jgi:hypothetical protein
MKDGKLLVISELLRPGRCHATSSEVIEFDARGEGWASAADAAKLASMPLFSVPELADEAPAEEAPAAPEAPEEVLEVVEAAEEPEEPAEAPAPGKNWSRATKGELLDELLERGLIDSVEEAEGNTKADLLKLMEG